MKHVLIITGDPVDPWEIVHPDDCPTAAVYDGAAWDYVCDVGREISAAGLQVDPSRLPAGEYTITYEQESQRLSWYGETEVVWSGVVVWVGDEPLTPAEFLDMILRGRRS